MINHQKLNSLLPEEQEYSCNSIDRVTNLPVGNQLPEKLKVNPGKTGNLQTELKLKVGAPIFITTNHSNKNIGRMDLLMEPVDMCKPFKLIKTI